LKNLCKAYTWYDPAKSTNHFMNLQEFLNISLEKAKENALPPCTGYLLQRYH